MEAGISTLQIAGPIANHAVTEREVLRARRCPDRVGLHEAECVERALQRGRREQAARDRSAPQMVDRHSAPLSMRGDVRMTPASGAFWPCDGTGSYNGRAAVADGTRARQWVPSRSIVASEASRRAPSPPRALRHRSRPCSYCSALCASREAVRFVAVLTPTGFRRGGH